VRCVSEKVGFRGPQRELTVINGGRAKVDFFKVNKRF